MKEIIAKLSGDEQDIVMIISPEEKKFNYISPAFQKITGIKAATIIKNPFAFLNHIHPDDMEMLTISDFFKKDFAGKPKDYRFISKNGTVLHFHSYGYWVDKNKEKKPYIIRIIKEVTSTRKNMWKQQTHQRYLEGLLDTAPICLNIYDLRQNKLHLRLGNLLKELGYSNSFLEEHSAYLWTSLIHQEDHLKIRKHLTRILLAKDDQTFGIEFRIKSADGKYIWMSRHDKVFERDQNNRPTKSIGTIQNIELIKHSELKLKEKIRQLELIAHLNSHQLRAPVASILGLSNILPYYQNNSEEIQDIIHKMKICAEDLDQILYKLNNMTSRSLDNNYA
ncbi:PAS domain-containing protein [Persicobacter sp. CCB-QB2]|uniref:PAS domain-containing protein n=1 Tax=Persicobacter sp. CCB-QB2 TaxID=1561025 RepID=UPI0006A9614F|nr:PAS domain-containing protein [Persicobacter sp. CCB-QB2]